MKEKRRRQIQEGDLVKEIEKSKHEKQVGRLRAPPPRGGEAWARGSQPELQGRTLIPRL